MLRAAQMKILIALCLCGLSLMLFAQTTPHTFTSQDGAFQFKYSPVLVHCTPEHTEEGYPGSWVPADTCSSQAGLCDPDAGSSATTIACVAHPRDKFKDKPTFAAAAFFVAEVRTATTEKACLEGSRYWNIEDAERAKIKMVRINGVTFKVFEIEDNWAGGGQVGPVYRTFHGKKCYELGIQTTISRGGYAPGTIKEFTKEDNDQVQRRLKQALNSFRFVK
jgi:hypothetical protein